MSPKNPRLPQPGDTVRQRITVTWTRNGRKPWACVVRTRVIANKQQLTTTAKAPLLVEHSLHAAIQQHMHEDPVIRAYLAGKPETHA